MNNHDPKTSDPNAWGWMQGFPPPKDRVIQFEDGTFYQWPQLRWTFSNIQQLVPTKTVWRGPMAAKELALHDIGLEQLQITVQKGETLTWQAALERTMTDGLAVMHKGKLVHESYYGACQPHSVHTVMSCGKSFAGLIAEILIARGELDEHALMSSYVPELKGTAWEDATLRLALDMLIGMQYSEDYLDKDSDVWRYIRAAGMIPVSPDDTGPQSLTEYLVTVAKEGHHGDVFAYREPNINAITWLLQRVTNKDIAELFSSLVWQHIGAEHDAYYMLDRTGFCTTPNCTLRDFVRLGEFVRTGGEEQQIRPDYIYRLAEGGDRKAFAKAKLKAMKGWSYNGLWWIRHTASGNQVIARGAHGQFLYIDPSNELVIAKFASTKLSPSYLEDHINIPLFDAITKHVKLAG